jgi:hypothetical protein
MEKSNKRGTFNPRIATEISEGRGEKIARGKLNSNLNLNLINLVKNKLDKS